jgi:hypothetical protein
LFTRLLVWQAVILLLESSLTIVEVVVLLEVHTIISFEEVLQDLSGSLVDLNVRVFLELLESIDSVHVLEKKANAFVGASRTEPFI